MSSPVLAVLFDLDGTLIDSAPDLAGTANDMRASRAMPAVAYESLRPVAGSGARGMIGQAFGVVPAQPEYEALRDEFHSRYEMRMLRETFVFEAMLPVLEALEQRGLVWGIVTNKALRYADPMAVGLGLLPRARVLIGGDSTPHTKPHPAPLLEASRRLALPPGRCAYVGDDARDIHAARAAGMGALAAAWGYIGQDTAAHQWGADAVLREPGSLLHFLDMA